MASNWIPPEKDNWDNIFNSANNKPQDSVADPPPSIDNSVNAMPNADKLSLIERGIYRALPGFAQSTIGQALAKLGSSWAGKALSYLDVAAEGVERTFGLANQLLTNAKNPDPNFNLKDAWYAGSLTADVMNLPMLSYDENGNVKGLKIPDDLPGAQGLVDARKKIASYVSQGMNEGDALVKVRDEYYNGLGALALRSQLYDTYFHVLADPLNYFLPELKPVERIQALADIAKTTKSAYTAEELLGMAAKTVDIAEAAKLTERAAQISSGQVKVINRLDKVAMLLTDNPASRIPLVGKFFELTPKSKALELMDTVSDNLGATAGRMWDDPEFAKNFTKFIQDADSAGRTQFGHALTTIEGRTTQAALGGSSAVVGDLYSAFVDIKPQRELLAMLKDSLGIESNKIIELAQKDPQILFRMIQQSGNEVLLKAVQNGNITPDILGTMEKVIGGLPYDNQTFAVHALAAVNEHVARQSIIQFGVKADGLPQRWSQAIKTAETLAFMRINPSYAIRNVVNNEITMLARGVFGFHSDEMVAKFTEEYGNVMSRISEGFTDANSELIGKGQNIIDKATRVNGRLEQFSQAIKDINLGKFDVAKQSGKFEQAASEVASINGFKQFINQFWKPTKIEKFLDPAVVSELERVQPGFTQTLNEMVKASGASDRKLMQMLGENINVNVNTIIEQASRNTGVDLSKVLDTEILGHINDTLPQAIKDNKVTQWLFETRQKIDQVAEERFTQNVQNLVDNVSAQSQAGGQQAFLDQIAKTQDLFWDGHAQHAIKSPEMWRAVDEAKSAKDWAKVDRLVAQNLQDDQKFFSRLFRRVDAMYQGLEDGAKALAAKGEKIAFPSEVRQAFKDFQKNWKDFFDFRNSEYERIKKLPAEERAQAFYKLRGELDARYEDAARMEDRLAQQADDAVANLIEDPQQRKLFTTWRDAVGKKMMSRKQDVIEFQKVLRNAPADQKTALYNKFWEKQKQVYTDLYQTDRAGLAAMQGNPDAIDYFKASRPPSGTIYDLAHQYGIPSAAENGARNDRRILNTVNKYSGEKYAKVADIPMEIAQKAFEARAADKGITAGKMSAPFIQDYKKIAPDIFPMDLGLDMTSYGHQYSALDTIANSAIEQAKKTPSFLSNLSPELQQKVMSAVGGIRDEFSGARLAAGKYGLFRRDSALLNYSRRTNFDALVGTIFPFAFWTTGSIQKWALESIDRPAMLTTYLRIKKLLETAGAPQSGFPSRFQDQIRIQLPFAPSWMGSQFVDPLRLLLPFDSFMQPYESWQQNQTTVNGRAERLLQDQLSNKKITQTQFDNAMQHQGPDWEAAISQTIQNDDSLKFDAWNFASLMSSPHAPITWAYNIARGRPEDIGPFTPMTGTIKNIATSLGVPDWSNSSYNIEARIRKQMGLPAFDKWEPYRIDREISNIAAESVRGENSFTMDEIKRAMDLSARIQGNNMTLEQAKQDPAYPVYIEAVKRMNQERTSGPAGTILNILGIPVHSYPEGEAEQRALAGDFSAAYQKYKDANGKMQAYLDAHPNIDPKVALQDFARKYPGVVKDGNALDEFFKAHPEYETRLGLFDTPQQRMQKFLVDQTWNTWNSLPKVTKDELKTQLGQDFQNAFLDKNTRDYTQISNEQMQVWMKLMGGKMPGVLTADQKLLTDMFSGQLKLTAPDTAWRAQVFYDTRTKTFPNYYDKQNEYYALPAAKRSAYLVKNPDLKQYWSWRTEFMTKNPDLVQYLTDDPKAIAKAQTQKRNPQFAVPTAQEIQKNISPAMNAILQDYRNGQDLPPSAESYLSILALQYGMTETELRGVLGIP